MTLLAVLLTFLPVSEQIPEPPPDSVIITADLNVKVAPDVEIQPRQYDLGRPDLKAEEPINASDDGTVDDVWYALAVCESGMGGVPTWDYDASRYDWGNGIFDGGLQFHPQTWTAFDGPTEFAWQATPAQQIEVAERVLAAQGWGAWPSCSAKLGLR